jgi:pSer/pThr/pTyr-binding forkhead associated (FHA) protein
MEATRVQFRNNDESQDSDFGHAPRILCLSPDLPDPFVIRKDAITIGRAPDCDIQIATDFVSRCHATIRRDKTSTIIEDRSSTNGVFVNSVRIDRKALTDGDEITIGESRFRFIAGEPLPEIHCRRFIE